MPNETGVKKENRDKVLPPCRVSDNERKLIKLKAAEAGISVSEYQRQALLNGYVVVRDNVIDISLVNQLSAIGNNLNQLVRKSHIHDDTDTSKMRDILSNIDLIIMGIVNGSES